MSQIGRSGQFDDVRLTSVSPKLGNPVSLINRSRATACSGNAMCATCHVYVDNGWLDQLRAMTGDEDALLDGAAAERRAESRLS